jgi:hypothetical protein
LGNLEGAERTEYVFNHHESPVSTIKAKIKTEASIWITVGAKGLGAFLVQE